jgi:hypothetical protein
VTTERRARVLRVEPPGDDWVPVVPLTLAPKPVPPPAGGAVASVALFLLSLIVAGGFTGSVLVRALAPEPPTVALPAP